MKVFKFGGASVSTMERIRNAGAIIKSQPGKLLVVVSAMGKTTNALEKVINAFCNGDAGNALQLFEEIKKEHSLFAEELLQKPLPELMDFYTEVEWLLHDKPVREYDYYYDQVVCVGELLSTLIVSRYLSSAGTENTWLDVRDYIRTDNNFRSAGIDWNTSATKITGEMALAFQQTDVVVTQGFIGATDENESTTLGREGSDYSAAVFASMLDAESLTIWKDVQGVMSADPKQYSAAQWIPELSYKEVIEMSFYGAQVIHPKTIKPLQNKEIPLFVRSFLQPADEGTIIHTRNGIQVPPIIVYKQAQVLLELNCKDFSFVNEGLTVELYHLFDSIKFTPNLTQNGATSIICVVDDHPEKVAHLAHAASTLFEVQVRRNLLLLTIRHYNEGLLNELCKDRTIILKQQTPETVQVLLQE
ncbi:MAG: aspartate kinase [Chitinophagaceae bacterium]